MSTTGTLRLNEPVTTQSPPRTAFFNGRLLSAEDLQREQTLREAGQAQLARLMGCGIERGFAVGSTKGSTVLTIAAGLGVTPSGQVIDFGGSSVDLAAAAQMANQGGGFGDCAAAFGDLRAPTAGLYLLVLTPAWVPAGRAATLLGEVGACNRNVEIPAARIRLVALTPPDGAVAASLRNQVALSLMAPQPGVVSGLVGWWPSKTAQRLGADDLPIAALQLDAKAQVIFVDAHAAQRRLAPPPGAASDALWPQSRAIEMEAFAQQCLAQWLDLSPSIGDEGIDQLQAAFVSLPPALTWQTSRLDLPQQGLVTRIVKRWGPNTPTLVSHAEFARSLADGLHGEPVPINQAQLEWLALPDKSRHLLRIRNPKEERLEQVHGEFLTAGRNEHSSPKLAAKAGAVLKRKNSTEEERSLAGSVLTQTRDKPVARKRSPAKPRSPR